MVTQYTPEGLSLIMEQLTKSNTQPAVLPSIYVHFTSIVKHQDVLTLMSWYYPATTLDFITIMAVKIS